MGQAGDEVRGQEHIWERHLQGPHKGSLLSCFRVLLYILQRCLAFSACAQNTPGAPAWPGVFQGKALWRIKRRRLL